jgi:hypothetical protein
MSEEKEMPAPITIDIDASRWERILPALAAPFDPALISWKPGATYEKRALGLAYVEPRAYIARLNEVCAGQWSDAYFVDFTDKNIFVTCKLTILGVTRSDVGEESHGKNAYTTAVAQAFKRACVKFELGAYLYSFPQEWVEYDPQKKRITPRGQADLQNIAVTYTKALLEGATSKPEPGTPEYLSLAARMMTPKRTPFGDLTADQLLVITDNAKGEAKEGAKALMEYLIKKGAGAKDTYNMLEKE